MAPLVAVGMVVQVALAVVRPELGFIAGVALLASLESIPKMLLKNGLAAVESIPK
ncbi:hypothetical protein RI444_18265 [Paenarthrobacter sp. AT5]|uniref:hypothetical protein n=1 Tax=Paenarthrobacter TaxID=1742992 RepID=UPI001A9911B0|nr:MULTISPECIES: hypothetical protein [Paenarthrobacter]WOC60431.1 hypothetical protein RI444_18265 [Paenarthrobacter sp. AT5]